MLVIFQPVHKGAVHLEAIHDWMILYQHLCMTGRLFIVWDMQRHHPWLRSRQMKELKQVLNYAVDVDLCRYGAMDHLSMPVRGERILLTNFAPLTTMHKMCDHGHTHRPTHRADEVNRFGWPESMVEKVVEMMCSVNERGV